MPIAGCVASGCSSNKDCGRGQTCENGFCAAAVTYCHQDSDCLTTDHMCSHGVCELRRKSEGKTSSKSSGKSNGKSSGKSRAKSTGYRSDSSRTRSRSKSRSSDYGDLNQGNLGCVWDKTGCHNLCDHIQMEERCQ